MSTNINKLARLALYMLCSVAIIASSATISATPLPDSEEEIFKSAAYMPKFLGGSDAMMRFINENLRYPQTAADSRIEGKVIVQFVVEKDGSIGEVKVVRGVYKDLDQEAVRVIKMLPKFYEPGRNAVGEPVRVWYTLPINFKLKEEKSPNPIIVTPGSDNDINETKSSDEIFKSAAHMPEFPGGDEALMRFLNENIRWPQETCAQGKVIVQFVVEKDGSVGEVKIVRRIDPALDREAVRVCKSLPNFYPATNFVGEPVRVWYTLPVTFKIQVPKE
ncbi:MAG: TonB family protein [Muribaculaceae bacterium]|nr:TonB family protein [Muribaculaceae bacterium]